MATSKDMREIMGLGAAGPKPVIKEHRPAQPRPRLTGISREVQALMGERGVPPVVLADSSKAYKPNRIRSDLVVRKWKHKPFTNPARKDGLVLRHWRRTDEKATPKPMASGETEEDAESPEPELEVTYDFAKYDIEITGASYDDSQYETHFHDENWTKEETDYLVDVVKEYYHRWPLIADRYDYRPPSSDSSTPTEEPQTSLIKPRSMEELKKRYYTIWAKSMELSTRGGLSNMNETEFALHETLRSFNPKTASDRKRVADSLLTRNADEVKEEEHLLAELQRIVANSQRFDLERAELRTRLEYPHSVASPAQYQTSQGLSTLFSALIQTERMRKRLPGPGGVPARLSLGMGDAANGSPSTAAGGNTTTPVSAGHRESLSASQKKGSVSAGAAPTPVRTISPRQEARYGITTHDRLASGVTFRSDKVLKMRQAKSGVQTQKIAAALAELGIPDLIQLPTSRVCEAFEKVVAGIGRLLEARKTAEREEGEIQVAEKVRAERLGLSTGEEGNPKMKVENVEQNGNGADEEKDAESEAEADADGGGNQANEEDSDAGDEPDATEPQAREEPEEEKLRPTSAGSLSTVTRAGRKRSASVLSQASRGSRGSVKKARK